MQQSRDLAAANDIQGAVHLMRAYGGLGSFNDSYPTDEIAQLGGKASGLAVMWKANHDAAQ